MEPAKSSSLGKIAVGVGLCTALICTGLIIALFSMAPRPGETVSCDACVGAGMIVFLLGSAAIGMLGGIVSIVLGITYRSQKGANRDTASLAILLGVVAAGMTPAAYLLMVLLKI